MKRPNAEGNADNPNARPAKLTVFEKTPLLLEHLCDSRWDDGSPRTTSTLTIFMDDGLVKACLNDRDANASLYVTGETLQEALQSIEKRLVANSPADWRRWGKKRK